MSLLAFLFSGEVRDLRDRCAALAAERDALRRARQSDHRRIQFLKRLLEEQKRERDEFALMAERAVMGREVE